MAQLKIDWNRVQSRSMVSSESNENNSLGQLVKRYVIK